MDEAKSGSLTAALAPSTARHSRRLSYRSALVLQLPLNYRNVIMSSEMPQNQENWRPIGEAVGGGDLPGELAHSAAIELQRGLTS